MVLANNDSISRLIIQAGAKAHSIYGERLKEARIYNPESSANMKALFSTDEEGSQSLLKGLSPRNTGGGVAQQVPGPLKVECMIEECIVLALALSMISMSSMPEPALAFDNAWG